MMSTEKTIEPVVIIGALNEALTRKGFSQELCDDVTSQLCEKFGWREIWVADSFVGDLIYTSAFTSLEKAEAYCLLKSGNEEFNISSGIVSARSPVEVWAIFNETPRLFALYATEKEAIEGFQENRCRPDDYDIRRVEVLS